MYTLYNLDHYGRNRYIYSSAPHAILLGGADTPIIAPLSSLRDAESADIKFCPLHAEL